MISIHNMIAALTVLLLLTRTQATNTALLGQDGHEKTLAPWVSHQHLPLYADTDHIKLKSQHEIHGKRMGRANRVKGGQELGERELLELGGISTSEGVVDRALKWVLQIEYSGQSFFDGWDFFTAPDPTHGIINYVDEPTALSQGLIFWTQNGTPGIQVEHWSKTDPGVPRNSVRIHTKSLFAGGLFVIDLELMPWGCGVWPAFWTLGYEEPWPQTGEIDIFEGIQSMINNQMTSHTTPGCVLNESPGLFTGTVAWNHVCDSSMGGSGCSIISPSNTSYGMPFNEYGGGVFAMLWDGSGIKIWNWNRAYIPANLVNSNPDPSLWGLPVAAWEASTCDPYTYFKAQQLILNINLCGDWAGNNYNQYPYCPGTCAEYVSDPNNLNNTVMLINHIRVYQQADVEAITQQATGVNNASGVGGPVAGNSTPGDAGGNTTNNPPDNTTAKNVPDWEKTGGSDLSTTILPCLLFSGFLMVVAGWCLI